MNNFQMCKHLFPGSFWGEKKRTIYGMTPRILILGMFAYESKSKAQKAIFYIKFYLCYFHRGLILWIKLVSLTESYLTRYIISFTLISV